MTRRLTQQDAAEMIFDAWAGAMDTGMSRKETLELTGLTSGQFLNGKAWLRDELCSNKEMPFSYDPSKDLYHLNANFEPVEEYWLFRLKVTAKQLQRLLDGTASPAKAKFGGRKIARMHRHTKDLILDLEDIVAGVGA